MFLGMKTCPFDVISGGRDQLESQLVDLVFTAGPLPDDEFETMLARLSPGHVQLGLVEAEQAPLHPEDAQPD